MAWYDDLCEYYGVTKEKAIELSTRSPGRKPSLPGSPTCQPVSGKTFEQLWDEMPRKTVQQKMGFYKDIGAWQAFRQCNYNKDIKQRYAPLFSIIMAMRGHPYCEYGCGVAPITNRLLDRMIENGIDGRMEFHLVDVPGEHLAFASWRLAKKMKHPSLAQAINVVFHEISEAKPIPYFGDTYFGVVSIMDVLEHVHNPLDVLKNIAAHQHASGVLVENWMRGGGADRENLVEAEAEREKCMDFIKENYANTHNEGYRIWVRKSI